MLHAAKQQMESRVRLRMARIRDEELRLYTRNCSMLGTQSAMLAGIAFEGLILTKTPHYQSKGSSTLTRAAYPVALACLLGFSLLALLNFNLIAMFGPGLALRGPDGSMGVAVDAAAIEYRTAAFYLTLGVITLHIALFLYAWGDLDMDSRPQTEVSAVVSTLAVIFLVGIFRSARETYRAFYYASAVSGSFEPQSDAHNGSHAGSLVSSRRPTASPTRSRTATPPATPAEHADGDAMAVAIVAGKSLSLALHQLLSDETRPRSGSAVAAADNDGGGGGGGGGGGSGGGKSDWWVRAGWAPTPPLRRQPPSPRPLDTRAALAPGKQPSEPAAAAGAPASAAVGATDSQRARYGMSSLRLQAEAQAARARLRERGGAAWQTLWTATPATDSQPAHPSTAPSESAGGSFSQRMSRAALRPPSISISRVAATLPSEAVEWVSGGGSKPASDSGADGDGSRTPQSEAGTPASVWFSPFVSATSSATLSRMPSAAQSNAPSRAGSPSRALSARRLTGRRSTSPPSPSTVSGESASVSASVSTSASAASVSKLGALNAPFASAVEASASDESLPQLRSGAGALGSKRTVPLSTPQASVRTLASDMGNRLSTAVQGAVSTRRPGQPALGADAAAAAAAPAPAQRQYMALE